ncbi:hypothetical protein [Pseudomonas duriflava]|nr:hypothetical protein [Pseudomonas duriflava]
MSDQRHDIRLLDLLLALTASFVLLLAPFEQAGGYTDPMDFTHCAIHLTALPFQGLSERVMPSVLMSVVGA